MPPSSIPPTNYLLLVRNHKPIQGTYVIDQEMSIPPSLLPPLSAGEAEEDRKNIRLESVNGLIDVELWLVAPARRDAGPSSPPKRATIYARSYNGTITAKLVCYQYMHQKHPHLFQRRCSDIPFHIELSTYSNGITLFLPRTFLGPLTITNQRGAINISEALSKCLTTFSEISSTRRCFVGDLSLWSEAEATNAVWGGDECVIESKGGRVKVLYEDEAVKPKAEGKTGFFGKVLGL